MSLEAIAALFGHKSMRMTMVYAKISNRTTRQARPGIRVPRRRAAELAHLTILVDSRERYPYKFTQQQAHTERRALPAGDHSITDNNDQIVGLVERKTLDEFVRRLIDGQLTYAIADMASLPRAAVMIEDRDSSLFKLEYAKPGFVAESSPRTPSATQPSRSTSPRYAPSPRNGPTATSAPHSPTPRLAPGSRDGGQCRLRTSRRRRHGPLSQRSACFAR